jgi:hypothetical protein
MLELGSCAGSQLPFYKEAEQEREREKDRVRDRERRLREYKQALGFRPAADAPEEEDDGEEAEAEAPDTAEGDELKRALLSANEARTGKFPQTRHRHAL